MSEDNKTSKERASDDAQALVSLPEVLREWAEAAYPETPALYEEHIGWKAADEIERLKSQLRGKTFVTDDERDAEIERLTREREDERLAYAEERASWIVLTDRLRAALRGLIEETDRSGDHEAKAYHIAREALEDKT